MSENKHEILGFLSELLSEIYEEQNHLREEMQLYNQKIFSLNQKVKKLGTDEESNECMFSGTAETNIEKKEEYSSQIEILQIKIFDMQERVIALQKRVDNVKKLSTIVDEVGIKQEEDKNTRTNVLNDKLRLLETQELERKRISMELHDTTVQNLTTLIHKTELCTKLMDIDVIRAKLELQTMTSTIRETINELRGIIYDLRPMSIDDLGLVTTLERFIKQMEIENPDGIPIRLVVHQQEVKVLPVINLTLFRIIQEAYNNTRKHAKAGHFDITITYDKDEIELEISDDGIGFQLALLQKENKTNNRNFGLSIMKERVDLLTGTMEVMSEQENGTKILIKVPIIKEEEYDTN
ncbi:sensor histidine kinase [Velocimicrobium porci]|uniref:Oxygen sensor histidine kinase NreB n=1 Tax=Velocimicrobium porci TaxID=2606634 RepID=A0A6L5XWI5_9FIRM|nr:sensor histidine kinase [Velocimicrobium porci]MSS62954.1 sensor histidine kinase [Velocimicrobium porci]